MNLTGHGKGYGYDMGAEADIAVAFGFLLLILWIIAVLPAFIGLGKWFYRRKKILVLIPAVGFAVFSAIGVFMLGWGEFITLFGGNL